MPILPRYQCHKEVYALKIAGIYHPGLDASAVLSFAEPGYEPKTVDAEWFQKFTPQVGFWYVIYDDGWTSVSPAKAFEEGYTRVE